MENFSKESNAGTNNENVEVHIKVVQVGYVRPFASLDNFDKEVSYVVR